MKVLLICPQCREKIPLPHQNCPVCGADLQNLRAADRCYYLGEAGKVVAGPATSEVKPLKPTRSAAPEAGDFPEPPLANAELLDSKEVSLCEALDRILHKGAVLFGEVTISVAGIDLVYLGLQVILASMETARGLSPGLASGQLGPNFLAGSDN